MLGGREREGGGGGTGSRDKQRPPERKRDPDTLYCLPELVLLPFTRKKHHRSRSGRGGGGEATSPRSSRNPDVRALFQSGAFTP